MSKNTLNNCVDIMLLVHYHCFPCENDGIRRAAPAYLESARRLLELELLTMVPVRGKDKVAASYATTEKGTTMVNKLLSVPLPVATWS